MTQKDRADLRLNCFYAAITIMGANSSSLDVLAEAKKLTEWVLGKKGDDK